VVGVTAAYPPILAESLTESLARPGAERHARVFAGVLAQVPEARAFTARALAGCPAGAREALLLCVTELAANAVEHSASGEDGVFAVEVSRPADGVAYVAVIDAGAVLGLEKGSPAAGSLDAALEGGVVESAAVDSGAVDSGAVDSGAVDSGAVDSGAVDDIPESGRGLALVAAFSSRWGCCDVCGRGRTVWAEATWPVLVPLGGIPQQAPWKDVKARLTPGDGAA
jgi:anti-sigma regulatory factor (Ser/Thr protein kinase)